ncbi:GNAT family N-acetyltransferase [Ornithinibacillus xuwenensis]|uniref:GNAT family N-acetyltransferase n=1 Tax=Ornithinibacillus xuwenensis TaxID=3144668 RepID=A0ABU9XL11_9BACI
MIPVLTSGLARRIEEAEISALKSRLMAIREIPGNPMGVDIQSFGHATAFSVKGIPGPAFNTVRGLTSEDHLEIEPIVDFYKAKNIPVQVEITPVSTSPELFQSLARSGHYQHSFHSVFYRTELKEIRKAEPSITIRRLRESEFNLFAEIYVKGFGLPNSIKQGIAQNNQVLYPLDSWEFYLAMINGEAVGIGVMFIDNGIALLAASASLPQYRNMGVHQALMVERMREASKKEVGLLVGQASYASISANNMQKLGLRLAYTKAIWKES